MLVSWIMVPNLSPVWVSWWRSIPCSSNTYLHTTTKMYGLGRPVVYGETHPRINRCSINDRISTELITCSWLSYDNLLCLIVYQRYLCQIDIEKFEFCMGHTSTIIAWIVRGLSKISVRVVWCFSIINPIGILVSWYPVASACHVTFYAEISAYWRQLREMREFQVKLAYKILCRFPAFENRSANHK